MEDLQDALEGRGVQWSCESPYYSKPKKVASWRPPGTAGSVPLGGRMSLTPQKLWLGTSKQGSLTQPLKSDLTLEHTWSNPPSSTPDYLSEALRMKRSNLSCSASNGHVPGTPVYREKEDMYDEIIELKKSLHMQRGDVDLMRTKLRRLEEENSRKDRQIEQLLDPSRVVNGLKQRILKLEQQCKEDSTINKLQTDMKTTDLEEMRVAMETHYEGDIHHLQNLLASSDPTGKKYTCLFTTRDRTSCPWLTPMGRGNVFPPQVPPEVPSWSLLLTADTGSHAVGRVSPPPGSGRATGLLEVKQLLQTKANLEKELQNVKESEKERREREEALREEIQTLTRKFQELEEMKKEENEGPMEISHELF
ncbi:IQ domain-containing protein E-like [Choloepus didactylus]|uniref:IQ domain-containing protein E-like n=1 Tax=Choloepus didactylus TaxID=27675 RepID=UPI0018A01334|nr:IQ domain-containing protein E-like [Choloepus didactylus]